MLAASLAAHGAVPRAERLQAAVDSMEVHLFYQGACDKPYYSLTLRSGPIRRGNPFELFAPLSREERKSLIGYLAGEGFLRHAVEEGDGKSGAAPDMKDRAVASDGYVLRVTFRERDGRHGYRENLGWDLAMLRRLEGMKRALPGEAARAMEPLVARLTGWRAQWEGEARASIERLVAWLSAHPLWENGLFPTLDLPPTASTEQVLSMIFRVTSFDAGRVDEHRILYSREAGIPGSLPNRYTAVLVATNQGQKIVLLRYTGRPVGWWSRVYDDRPPGASPEMLLRRAGSRNHCR